MITTLGDLRKLVEQAKNEDDDTPILVNVNGEDENPCYRHLSGKGWLGQVDHDRHGDVADAMAGDTVIDFQTSEG